MSSKLLLAGVLLALVCGHVVADDCPDGTPIVNCVADPCSVTSCPSNPDADCVADYCGGCNARFYNAAGEEIIDCRDCPDGTPVVSCIADPCSVTSCPSNPDAVCVADYCGGCNARFYNAAGEEIIDCGGRQCPNGTMDSECGTPCRPTCLNPSPEFCITSCAKGCFCPTGMLQLDAYTLECFPRLLCAVDPCSVTQCHAYPNAVCKPDSCTCNARFLVDGEEIKDCKNECLLPKEVGNCDSIVPSFFYNATSRRCEGFNYGGCDGNNSRFDSIGSCIEKCGPSTCADDTSLISCYPDPCSVTRCPAHPDAECVADYCGGCNARFYNAAGEQITNCEGPVSPPPVLQYSTCPPLPADTIGTCDESCPTDRPCGAGMECCSNGCGNACVNAVNITYYEVPLTCPDDHTSQLGICPSQCTIDSDCVASTAVGSSALCCRTECGGRLCSAGVTSTRPCDTLHERLDRSMVDEDSIPECRDDGSFSFRQCNSTSGECWCVNVHTGRPVSRVFHRTEEVSCPICEADNGDRYFPGEDFPSDDGCNRCFCSDSGVIACTLIACPDVCTLEREQGNCRGYFPSYYYNSDSEECELFVYGGCGGNGNRFSTLEGCLRRCDSDSKCLLRPEAGFCEAYIPSYFFNGTSDRCEEFIYGGCDGNDNKFSTYEECQRECPNVGVFSCELIFCSPPLCEDGSNVVTDSEHCCPYCPTQDDCDDDEFVCNDGSCIAEQQRCDGLRDCPNGEDEPNESCSPTIIPCEVYCREEDRCIPEDWECDGHPDCISTSDESYCELPIPISDIPYHDLPRECPSESPVATADQPERCQQRSDCSEREQLCCSGDCVQGLVVDQPCTKIVDGLTQSQLNLTNVYVPRCSENGTFAAIQCWNPLGKCWCVHTQNGRPISDAVPFDVALGCDVCMVGDNVYQVGQTFTAEDGCNTCLCGVNGMTTCTAIACVPDSCRIRRDIDDDDDDTNDDTDSTDTDSPDDNANTGTGTTDTTPDTDGEVFGHGELYEDECTRCTCLFGQLNNCTRKPCSSASPIQGRLRTSMPYAADFNRISLALEDFIAEVKRTLLRAYFNSMRLEEAQIDDVEVTAGSVIVTVYFIESGTGANLTILVGQMEQDFNNNMLVIHYGNEALVPSGQFSSSLVEQPTQSTTATSLLWWHILIIVVGGLAVIIVGVIVIVALVLVCTKRRGSPAKAVGYSKATEEVMLESTANDYEEPVKRGPPPGYDTATRA